MQGGEREKEGKKQARCGSPDCSLPRELTVRGRFSYSVVGRRVKRGGGEGRGGEKHGPCLSYPFYRPSRPGERKRPARKKKRRPPAQPRPAAGKKVRPLHRRASLGRPSPKEKRGKGGSKVLRLVFRSSPFLLHVSMRRQERGKRGGEGEKKGARIGTHPGACRSASPETQSRPPSPGSILNTKRKKKKKRKEERDGAEMEKFR